VTFIANTVSNIVKSSLEYCVVRHNFFRAEIVYPFYTLNIKALNNDNG